jgi:hypothetical protein
MINFVIYIEITFKNRKKREKEEKSENYIITIQMQIFAIIAEKTEISDNYNR